MNKFGHLLRCHAASGLSKLAQFVEISKNFDRQNFDLKFSENQVNQNCQNEIYRLLPLINLSDKLVTMFAHFLDR